ncbi:MAG: hypothetical protein LBQ63_06200 [Deltaproteobacteria bacterium]|jgi:type III secretion system needle length determinant|nr:hypothetical protein [Deltaproteobacteria bacterium]
MSNSVNSVGNTGAPPSSLPPTGEYGNRPLAEGEAESFRMALLDENAAAEEKAPASAGRHGTEAPPAPQTPRGPQTPHSPQAPQAQEAGRTPGGLGMEAPPSPQTPPGPQAPRTPQPPQAQEAGRTPGGLGTEAPRAPQTQPAPQATRAPQAPQAQEAGKTPGGLSPEALTAPEAERKTEGEGRADVPPSFSGDALLRSLGQNYAPLETGGIDSVPPDTSSLAEDLVERILVSRESQAEGKGGEVRLTLKESLLPDTEIVIRREEGKLLVILNTSNASSQQVLLGAREELQAKLTALEKEVSVEVSLGGQGEEAGEDSRHSRGLDYISEWDQA